MNEPGEEASANSSGGPMDWQEGDPQQIPATPDLLHRMARRGLLDAAALEAGLKILGRLPDRQRWLRFLDILLLVLASGFTLSGIFFFFAYNWANLHRFAKLGLVEAALVAAVGLAYGRGLDRLSGKIALSAAALLTGALLGVYGQIYQTGADSYLLFLKWSALILGWVLISRFAPLWFLWAALLNLTLGLYWIQTFGPPEAALYLLYFALNAAGIAAWEAAHAQGIAWLGNRWLPRLLALPATIALMIPAIDTLAGDTFLQRPPHLYMILLTILYFVAAARALLIYSRSIPDLFMLTTVLASLIVVINAGIFNRVVEDELTLLLMGGLLLAETALALTWLRRTAASWRRRAR